MTDEEASNYMPEPKGPEDKTSDNATPAPGGSGKDAMALLQEAALLHQVRQGKATTPVIDAANANVQAAQEKLEELGPDPAVAYKQHQAVLADKLQRGEQFTAHDLDTLIKLEVAAKNWAFRSGAGEGAQAGTMEEPSSEQSAAPQAAVPHGSRYSPPPQQMSSAGSHWASDIRESAPETTSGGVENAAAKAGGYYGNVSKPAASAPPAQAAAPQGKGGLRMVPAPEGTVRPLRAEAGVPPSSAAEGNWKVDKQNLPTKEELQRAAAGGWSAEEQRKYEEGKDVMKELDARLYPDQGGIGGGMAKNQAAARGGNIPVSAGIGSPRSGGVLRAEQAAAAAEKAAAAEAAAAHGATPGAIRTTANPQVPPKPKPQVGPFQVDKGAAASRTQPLIEPPSATPPLPAKSEAPAKTGRGPSRAGAPAGGYVRTEQPAGRTGNAPGKSGERVGLRGDKITRTGEDLKTAGRQLDASERAARAGQGAEKAANRAAAQAVSKKKPVMASNDNSVNKAPGNKAKKEQQSRDDVRAAGIGRPGKK